MSLIIATINADRIMVAMDTAVFAADDTFSGFMAKAHLLPHLDVVVAGRGSYIAIQDAAVALARQSLPRGLDSVAEAAPNVIAPIWSGTQEMMLEVGVTLGKQPDGDTEHISAADMAGLLEIVAFGYSRERGEMMGYQFASYRDFEPEPLPAGGLLTAPLPPDGAPAVPSYPSDGELMAGMRALYDHMVGWSRGEGLTAEHCGGGVRVFEITHDGVTSRRIGALPNHDRLARELGIEPAPTDNVVSLDSRNAHPGRNAAGCKVGRNQPCPCGSGRKAKRCCGA